MKLGYQLCPRKLTSFKEKDMTKEEIQNILILVEAGARAIAAQNPMDKASGIFATAHELSTKLAKLSEPAEAITAEG